jgi:hypothetical protein
MGVCIELLRLFFLYKFDWLCAIAAGLIGGLPQVLIEPSHHVWSPDDFTLQAQRDKNIVPSWPVLFITVLCGGPVSVCALSMKRGD